MNPPPLLIHFNCPLPGSSRDQILALSPRIELLDEDQLAAAPDRAAEVEILFGRFGPDDLARFPRLKWLQSAEAGVDRVTESGAGMLIERNILVTAARGIHAEAMAETLFGLLLARTRRMPECVEFQQRAHWGRSDLLGRLEILAGRTLGLLGVGAIGQHLARVGRVFGMTPIGCTLSGKSQPDLDQVYPVSRLGDFLARSQVLMNTLPLTPQTRGLIGACELALLPRGAWVVNGGRGATMETAALVAALDSGQIGALLIDVVDPEPLPPDHPLWKMPNVIIAPHIGGLQPDYPLRAANVFVENLTRYLNGQPLNHQTDFARGY